jgi:hypothetical protein
MIACSVQARIWTQEVEVDDAGVGILALPPGGLLWSSVFVKIDKIDLSDKLQHKINLVSNYFTK